MQKIGTSSGSSSQPKIKLALLDVLHVTSSSSSTTMTTTDDDNKNK
jgi:hypothetical protein